MKPLARSAGLVKQVVGTETLVYDTNDAAARRLNALSSTVWRHCTGKNTVDEIAMLVAAEVELPAGADPVTVTWGALEELEQHGLLQATPEQAAGGAGVGRRDVLVTLAALPIFPSIDRIFAPRLSNAASAPPSSTETLTATASASMTASSTGTSVPAATASATALPAVSASASAPAVSQSATATMTPTPTRTASSTPPAVSQSATPAVTPSNTPTRP